MQPSTRLISSVELCGRDIKGENIDGCGGRYTCRNNCFVV